MSDPFVEDAGAYVLGMLTEAERAAFTTHLRECADCRQSVAELEDLPGLLALVPAEGPADPPPSVLAGLLGQVERLERADELAARRARRGRQRRGAWWAGIGVAAAAVVGGVATGVVPTPWTQDEDAVVATSVELRGAADVPVTASVDLLPVRWGTKVELTCAYAAGAYAQPVEYSLVVHDAAGRSEQVATWTVVPGAELTVPASTAIPLDDITRVEMVWDGQVVLSAEL